jgi:hypothetical protein
MIAVIERIMFTWNLTGKRTAEASREAKARVTRYLQPLFDGGETDSDRLAMFGLSYLRQLQPVRIRRRSRPGGR